MAIIGNIIIRMGADTRPLQTGLDSTISRISRFAGSATRFLGGAALAGVGLGGAVGLVKSITAASNLNETLSKTGIIFGGSAGVITKKAEELSGAFGVNKDEYINAAAGFGAVFKGVGKSQEDAAGLGNTLTQLGMDMAAFDNTSNADAFTALSSALRGEFDPIEKYRVFLSAAKIEQKALDMGLASSKGTIDEHAKKMATLALITEGTADAQGNLALTANEPAAVFRKLQGQAENMAIAFGQVLLPAVSKGASLLAEFGTFAMGVFEGIKPTLMDWMDTFTGVFDVVAVLFRNFGSVGQIVWLKVQEGGMNLLSIFEVLPANLGIIAEYIGNNWANLIIDAVNAVGSVFQNLGTNLGNLFVATQNFLAGKGFQFDWTPLLQGFEATSEALPELVKPHLVSMQGEIDNVAGDIANNEAKRGEAMARATGAGQNTKPFDPSSLGGAAAKAAEYHATAAVEFGSKEASSAITRFRNGGSSDDKPIKDVAKTAKQQLSQAERQTTALEKLAGTQGGAALQTFALGT